MPRRTDRNQKEMVELLRDLGLSVRVTSDLGKGFPDLTVGYNDRTYLVELKDGSKPPSCRKLTTDEQEFFDNWKGHACVIETINEAIVFANKVRKGLI